MWYFLNWELFSSNASCNDVTQGNEVIEIFIYDIDGCRPVGRFTLPILQKGRTFAQLKVNLLYQNDRCPINTLKHIFVQVRILRGIEQRLLYTNDFVLLAPYYIDGRIRRIPIHRVCYQDRFYKTLLANAMPPVAQHVH
jgi:hypothetical protein